MNKLKTKTSRNTKQKLMSKQISENNECNDLEEGEISYENINSEHNKKVN